MKNNPAKLHPDPICNDGALGFFVYGRSNNKNKPSSDMRSVPNLTNYDCVTDQELPGTGGRCVFSYQVAALVCAK